MTSELAPDGDRSDRSDRNDGQGVNDRQCLPTRPSAAAGRISPVAGKRTRTRSGGADDVTPFGVQPITVPTVSPTVPPVPLTTLAVRPAGPGVCRICFDGVAAGGRVCRGCRSAERRLGLSLQPITPISLATDGSAIYEALRQYKWVQSSDGVRRQRLRLARLVADHLSRHRSCMAPDGWDAVTVVPSLRGRAGPHPLLGVLAMIDEVAEAYIPALRSAARFGNLPRVKAADGWYIPHPLHRSRIRGARFLLVDDTYTTGAHLHSARATLLAAGASSVTALVIGRRVNRTWEPSRVILEWASQAGADGSWPWCARCAPC